MSYVCRLFIRKITLYKNISKYLTGNNSFNLRKNLNPLCFYNDTDKNSRRVSKILTYSTILTWLGLSREDEEKESELIMTIKRSVLSIQRNEFNKAEQLLHVALRLAQEQNDVDGITYIYDLLANLAIEREQINKAEKLFVHVLQRLLASGVEQEDVKVIHISLKLARICQMKKEYEKAELGYIWCLDKIKKYLDNNDKDAFLLNVLIKDWYSNFLSGRGDYQQCLKHLEDAYEIYTEFEGKNNQKTMLLLNDLGTTNSQLGNLDSAQKQLLEAISIGNNLHDTEYIGVLYANYGLVKMKQGLFAEAKKYCTEGWRIGTKYNNNDAVTQANYCLKQLQNSTN